MSKSLKQKKERKAKSTEIKEFNKLCICMKQFANSVGMACSCDKCYEEIYKMVDKVFLPTPKLK